MGRRLLVVTAVLGALLVAPASDLRGLRLGAPAEAGIKGFFEKVGETIAGGATAAWNAGSKAVMSAADWVKEKVLDPLLDLLKQAFLRVIRPALDLIKKADCNKLLDTIFQADKMGTGSWVAKYPASCAHEFNKGFICSVPQLLVDIPNALEQAAQSAWEHRGVCFPVGMVAGGMSPVAAVPILACGVAYMIKDAATQAWSCLKNAPEDAGRVLACSAVYAVTDDDPPPACPKDFPSGGSSGFWRSAMKAGCKLAGGIAFDVAVGLATGGASVPTSIMKRIKDAIKAPGKFIRVKTFLQRAVLGGKAMNAIPGCSAKPRPPVWRAWKPLPDQAPAEPALSSWGGGRLDLFYVDAGRRLRHKVYEEDLGWTRAVDLGGPFKLGPAAVSRGPGRIDLFAVHHPDNAVWHRTYENGSWQKWKSLGGVSTSSPAVASWGADRLDLFVRGSGGALWQRSYAKRKVPLGGGRVGLWTGWVNLGGKIIGKPAAVSWGPNRIDVFVRGIDNRLYTKPFNGRWHPFAPLGGTLTAGPAVASWAANHLDVYVRNVRGGVEHKYWTGKEWSRYVQHFGAITSAPAAVSWGRGRIDLVARGNDGRLWHSYYGKGTGDPRTARLSLAWGQKATQSGTAYGGQAGRAVDGNRSGSWHQGSVTHTPVRAQPWWQVDLGRSFSIEEIRIANRTDCCSSRLSNYFVMVSDHPFSANALGGVLRYRHVWRHHVSGTSGPSTKVKVGRRGRYVRIQLAGKNALSLAEVEVLGRP